MLLIKGDIYLVEVLVRKNHNAFHFRAAGAFYAKCVANNFKREQKMLTKYIAECGSKFRDCFYLKAIFIDQVFI